MAASAGVPKYNAKVHKVIVDAIRSGNYKSTAARLANIHPDTLNDWLRAGRDQPERYPDYFRLNEHIEQAGAEWEAEMVEMVRGAAVSGAPNTWQAAMTFLERKAPDKWGKRDTVKVDADAPLIQLNQVILNDANARQLSRDLLRQLATGGADEPLGIGTGGESETIEDGEFAELSD